MIMMMMIIMMMIMTTTTMMMMMMMTTTMTTTTMIMKMHVIMKCVTFHIRDLLKSSGSKRKEKKQQLRYRVKSVRTVTQ
jgi:hypothetical protein